MDNLNLFNVGAQRIGTQVCFDLFVVKLNIRDKDEKGLGKWMLPCEGPLL